MYWNLGYSQILHWLKLLSVSRLNNRIMLSIIKKILRTLWPRKYLSLNLCQCQKLDQTFSRTNIDLRTKSMRPNKIHLFASLFYRGYIKSRKLRFGLRRLYYGRAEIILSSFRFHNSSHFFHKIISCNFCY